MEYLTKLFDEALAAKRKINVRWAGKDGREFAGCAAAFRNKYVLVIPGDATKYNSEPVRIKYEKVKSIGGAGSPVTIYFGDVTFANTTATTITQQPIRKSLGLLKKKKAQPAK